MCGAVVLVRRYALTFILAFVAGLSTGPKATAGMAPPSDRPSVAPIVRAITPGVVNIATKKVVTVSGPSFHDPLFREFFGVPQKEIRREMRSSGSGVIVDAVRGYVLTNDHVVGDADSIDVTTKDNRRFRAKLVGRDRPTDVALLRIEADDLVAVPLGDSSSLEVGDFVLAIGNPFGLGQTVTSGIVSALGRTGLGIEGYEDFIQTDASVNPGNSGGALVTLDGRLVGINTAILSKSGGNVGIGFAVPINMARLVMDQLVANGEMRRGHIGLRLREARSTSSGRSAKPADGAMIDSVEPASPAAHAGLARGDVVVAANGVAIANPSALRNFVGLLPIGAEVDLRYRRGSQIRRARVRIEAPKPKPAPRRTTEPEQEMR
jgi:serine protease Do